MKTWFVLFHFFLCSFIYTTPQVPDISELSLDEKIGQLIMIAAVSAPDLNQLFMQEQPYHLEPSYTERMITQYHVGGVLFLGAGTPQQQIKITQKLQSLSKHPLLIGLDAEWGLSMRHIKDVVPFARAAVLGKLAPEYDYLIYEIGKEIGCHCAALGVHINFAPVADVNSNPNNPIINTRSFGNNPHLVAHKATLFMRGMQDAGILTCAKHFPGHGDTSFDSHLTFGTLSHSKKRLHEIELAPFQHLIHEGVDSVMIAHLAVPALAEHATIPATTSHNIITDLLRKTMNFKGLVITDGLGMRGITDLYTSDQVAVKALQAGVDLLLCPVDVPLAIQGIKKAIQAGELSESELDSHVERILQAKHRAITKSTPSYNPERLITPKAVQLVERVQSLTDQKSP